MEYICILSCKAMTTDKIWVYILINNNCGIENFLNVYIPVSQFGDWNWNQSAWKSRSGVWCYLHSVAEISYSLDIVSNDNEGNLPHPYSVRWNLVATDFELMSTTVSQINVHILAFVCNLVFCCCSAPILKLFTKIHDNEDALKYSTWVLHNRD